MTGCRICKRKTAPSSEFCRFHEAAKQNIESAYKAWDEGYGGMSWKDYLATIRKNPETGRFAKEVAELLAEQA